MRYKCQKLAAGVERTRVNRSSGNSSGATGGSGGQSIGTLTEEEKKRRMEEARKREEEELQLALAISQSEAEEKERQKQAQILRMYASRPADEASQPLSNSYKGTQPAPTPQQEPENPELSRYLDRSYWDQRQRENQKQAATDTGRKSPAPSAPPTVESPPPPPSVATNGHLNGEARVESVLPLGVSSSEAETLRFTEDLKAKVEVFVNRIRSNQARGRSIVHDSGINSLFLELTAQHADVLNRLNAGEDRRTKLESLQDKAAHVGEARSALTALREETKRQREEAEAEEARRRQAQLQQQLQVMRLQKAEMIERQRLQTLANMQNHQTELVLRRHYQAHGIPQPPPGTPIVYLPDQNGQMVPAFAPTAAQQQQPQQYYAQPTQPTPAAQPLYQPTQQPTTQLQPTQAQANEANTSAYQPPATTPTTQATTAAPNPAQAPAAATYQVQPTNHVPAFSQVAQPNLQYTTPPPTIPQPQIQVPSAAHCPPTPQPSVQTPVAATVEPPVDNLINFD